MKTLSKQIVGKSIQASLVILLSFTIGCGGGIVAVNGDQDYCTGGDCSCLSTQFSCTNGECIDNSLVCDGTINCGDGSDEQGCSGDACTDEICPCDPGQFTCLDGSCIADSLVCDGSSDCASGFDEVGCGTDECTDTICPCETAQFTCNDWSCISDALVCNGTNDCPDGSDEINCGCDSNQFQCGDNSCISDSLLCNGSNDCSDGSDEVGCSCEVGQFTCTDNSCISNTLVCDGNQDCPDGFDEANCGCSSTQYTCTDGNCIENSLVCDGSSDCSDGIDELGCSDPEYPPVSIAAGGMGYWEIPYYSNALYFGSHWSQQSPCYSDSINQPFWENMLYDTNGYPQYLPDGDCYQNIVFGMHMESHHDNFDIVHGRVTLTWKGQADIRLQSGDFIAASSNGSETGMIIDGIRAYDFITTKPWYIHIYEMEGKSISDTVTHPLTDIKVWLPDPDDPTTSSLVDVLWHPTFVDRLQDEDWGFIRFMDIIHTNNNPERDWIDRRLPSHSFQTGLLNPRSPAPDFFSCMSCDGSDSSCYDDCFWVPLQSDTGVAWEHLVSLCNQAGLDLWINIPHLTAHEVGTEHTYIRKLAQLIRFGSDGVEPYTSTQANPIWAPLNPEQKVFIEYSNEIWADSYAFAQGTWAQAEGTSLGISKQQYNARRFCEAWSIFKDVFEGSHRLVNVAAVWTGLSSYTTAFLDEMAIYCPNLTPSVEPDVIAPTTYFGNGIQDYVLAQNWLDSIDDNTYWTSQQLENHINIAFDEWKRRMLSGDAQEGAGPDATGIGGGFGEYIHDASTDLTRFTKRIPIVAYEGGPSLYTDGIESTYGSDPGNKGYRVTQFISAMNAHPRIAEVYRIHLHMAHSHGLTTHTPYYLSGSWGRYGQWGHLRRLDEDIEQAYKYKLMRDWTAEAKTMRLVDDPLGEVPAFSTAYNLPSAIAGQTYSTDIQVTGGDGLLSLEVIDSYLSDGLTASIMTGSPDYIRISGTPTEAFNNYIYALVKDSNKDVARRTFTLKIYGGTGTLVESNLEASNPSASLPWTNTYVLDNSKISNWSGIDIGAGVNARDGENAIYFDISGSGEERDTELSEAMAANEYFTFTITPYSTLDLRQATMKFTFTLIEYHAPRKFAVMTSIEGFSTSTVLYETDDDRNLNQPREFSFKFPDTTAYQNITTPVEIRIYLYNAAWGGHDCAFNAFKLMEHQ